MSTIIQALTFNLASPIDATQTSIPVRNLKDSRGNAITSLPIPSLVYATLEPRSSSNQEIISFTGITNNGNGIVTLTGVTRNLNPQPPYNALAGTVPHGNNAECILSNNPPFYNNFLQADTSVVITGNYQFPEPTLPANAATKNYVDTKFITLAGNDIISGSKIINGNFAFNVSPTIPDASAPSHPVSYAQLLAAALIGIPAGFNNVTMSYADDGSIISIHDNQNGKTYVLDYDDNGFLTGYYDGVNRFVGTEVEGRFITSITS
jgi:hypothetical protein